MSMVRYLFLSLNVLNGLLAAAVAAVVFFAVIPFLSPAAISLPPAKGTVAGSGEKASSSQGSPPADYAVISEQNLFHPDRKIPPEKKIREKEKAIPKPELFLYGTLILEDTSFAFVEDKKAPYSTEGRGKRQRTLKKGESLGGYILSEVETDRIVLVKGEEKLVVTLDDKAKRRGDASAAQMGAGKATGGLTPYPAVAPSPPQAAPASAQAVTSPAPKIGDPGILDPRLTQRPQTMPAPASEQTGPSSPVSGIGSSGTWPPTKSSIEQTRQKIEEGRQMRMEQMQKKQ